MKRLITICAVVTMILVVSGIAQASLSLGTAENFGVLGHETVTNTGNTIINGDLGLYPGTSITGFFGTAENDGPGVVTGTVHQTDTVAQQAQIDVNTAYTSLAAMTPTQDLTADPCLGGKTLTAGVYFFSSSAGLTGTLTLSGTGDFVFQIGSTLTTASGSSVLVINGADASNVYWQVGSSATLGTGAAFIGNILALTSITLNGGTLDGRALARNGAVTISSAETINVPGYVPSESNNAILVYKVTTAINPVIVYNDATGLEADVGKENLSAYVVFGVDDAYGVDDVTGANGPTVILFGKDGREKFQITLGGNEPKSFVYLWTFGSDDSVKPFVVSNQRNTIATSVGIEFGSLDTTTDFSIETELYGKNTTIDIGQAEKFSVPKSLKGQVWFESEGQFLEGWGAANATLDSKLTKDANKNSRTVAATVANIQTTVLRIYTPVTVLP